jgi:hypothetical protein
VTTAQGITVTPDAPAHLREVSRTRGDGDLRPYLPAAVCKILLSMCRFQKTEPVLDPTMVDRVAGIYFTHQSATRGDPVASRAITLAPAPEPAAPPTEWSSPPDGDARPDAGGQTSPAAEADPVPTEAPGDRQPATATSATEFAAAPVASRCLVGAGTGTGADRPPVLTAF